MEIKNTNGYKVYAKSIFNQHQKEIGWVLSAHINKHLSVSEKALIEDQLSNEVYERYRAVTIFKHSFPDTAGITVFLDINNDLENGREV